MRLQLLLSLSLAGCASEPQAPPAREAFAAMCATYFECGCEVYRHRDLDACIAVHHAGFAELFGSAAAAGLHSDLECYLATHTPDEQRCLGHDAYAALHADEPAPREPSRCGECQVVYGERQAGEPCLAIAVGASDCAQGLLCIDAGVCVDPCAPTPVGEPCDWGATICGPGRYCDEDDQLCRALAGVDESCLDTECDEGLVCDSRDFCVVPPGPDERCGTARCQDGLECLHLDTGMLCKPPPAEGEYCEERCAGDLRCDRDDLVCFRPAEVGEDCVDDEACASRLCRDGRCVAMAAEGEACIDGRCGPALECEGDVCVPERARVCWR